MVLFADRSVEFFGSYLPVRSIARFPPSMAEELVRKETWDDLIVPMHDIYSPPAGSIDLSTMFSKARETECLPSFDELDSLYQLVKDCNADIEALNIKIPESFATISKLFRDLKQMTCQLVRRYDQIEMAEYIISPPKHLPQDVLEQIFLQSWRLIDSGDSKPHILPLRLAAVCHRWRSVALSMPILWSRIYVAMNNEQSTQIAKFLIPRAGRNLSLILQMKGYPPEPSAEDFVRFLADSSFPVRNFSGWSIESRFHSSIPSFTQDQTRDIEEFAQHGKGIDDLCVPKVRRLFLHRAPCTWKEFPQPNFPYLHHLTVLYLRCASPFRLLDVILNGCPQLRTLHIGIAMGHRENPMADLDQWEQLQTHHHLVHLSVSYEVDRNIPPILLPTWTFPKLQRLSYGVRTMWTHSYGLCIPSQSLLSQIVHLSVTLDEQNQDDEPFLSIIQCVHSLEYLTLRGPIDNTLSCLIRYITQSPEDTTLTLLSQLKRVHIISDLDPNKSRSKYGWYFRRFYEVWAARITGRSSEPTTRPQFIVEVDFGYGRIESDEILVLSSYLKKEEDETDDSKTPRPIDIQVWWNITKEPEFVGRFWPLPFDHEMPKFGILTSEGEWMMRIGDANE